MRLSPLRLAEVGFWLILALALISGGGDALSGLPALIGTFLPSGIMAAHADAQGPASRVMLPLQGWAARATSAPEVLNPVVAHGFPEWLAERVHFARLADGASAAPSAGAPVIAIVIDDLGPDVSATRRAIALAKPITLSFLPYGNDTPALARAAVGAGHQVIVHVPMEPEGAEDPGPMALRTDLSAAANLKRLDWALARIPSHAGINNHMGSRFTADAEALLPVMARLSEKGGFFLDSRTTPHSVALKLAHRFGILAAGRDVFLDDRQTPDYVRGQLAETERIARETGVAIAIGHPHAVTLDVLKAWVAQARAHGYRLVALGKAIRLKTEDRARRTLAAAETVPKQRPLPPPKLLPSLTR